MRNYTIFYIFILLTLPIWGQTKQTYSVGDIYDVDGVRGIVVQVNKEGTHGLVMSLDEGEDSWSRRPKKRFNINFYVATNATNKNDGMANMEAIAQAIEQHGVDWSWFPAFQWCRNKGEGWYLPAINELVEINKAYHGGKIESNNTARKKFNNILKRNGGQPFKKFNMYFSSTEITGDKVYAIYLEKGMFAYGLEEGKTIKHYLRAVHKF